MKSIYGLIRENRKALQVGLILYASILLFSSCGNKFDSQASSDLEEDSFTGSWILYESWQGCENDGEDKIPIEITRKDNRTILTVAGQAINCQVLDLTLQCAGQLEHKDGSLHEYTNLTLWLDENRKISGEAAWAVRKPSGVSCSGTSTISSAPSVKEISADSGAIRIENRTEDQFKLLNIVPCEVSFSPWGENKMRKNNVLAPKEDYQINGIPEGCYSVRVCKEFDAYDNSNCIVYHQNIYVEKNIVHTIALGLD